MAPLRHLAAAAAAAALLASGCARNLPGGTRCSSKGGPAWREYRSAHFVLFTDLDREAAAAHVEALERIRALELQAWMGDWLGARPAMPGRLQVVVPAEPETYWAIAPYRAVGFFHVSWMGTPYIVFAPDALTKAPEIIAHELAHYLSRFVFPRQPSWFSEGVVQFVSTVANTGPRYARAAGVVPWARGPRLLTATTVPAGELLAWRGRIDREEFDRHHIYSWLLYHWLWNERSAELTEYQRRLAAAEEPEAAWLAAFPEFDPGSKADMRRLDEALLAHRTNGEFTYYQVEAAFEATFTERRVTPADVHMLLVELADLSSETFEVSEALREDPDQPVAIALDARRRKQSPVERLRSATAGRPGDWRVWYLLADWLKPAGDAKPGAELLAEREAALRKASSLEPEAALPQYALGRLLADSGRPGEALPFARRAAALSPWAPGPLDLQARVTSDLGDCARALSLQRRAVGLLRDPQGKSPYRKALREYQERCGPPGNGPGTAGASAAP